jgi:hypothetical protein
LPIIFGLISIKSFQKGLQYVGDGPYSLMNNAATTENDKNEKGEGKMSAETIATHSHYCESCGSYGAVTHDKLAGLICLDCNNEKKGDVMDSITDFEIRLRREVRVITTGPLDFTERNTDNAITLHGILDEARFDLSCDHGSFVQTRSRTTGSGVVLQYLYDGEWDTYAKISYVY